MRNNVTTLRVRVREGEESPLLKRNETPPRHYDSTGEKGNQEASSSTSSTSADDRARGTSTSTGSYTTMEKDKVKRLVSFGLLTAFVVFLYALKGALGIVKYARPWLCQNSTIPVEEDDSPELQGNATAKASFYFTIVVYAVADLIRCIQYIPFFIGLYQFYVAWREHEPDWLQGIRSQSLRTYPPCYFIVFLLAVVFLFSLSIPATGIYLEYLHEKKTICNLSWTFLFNAYCVVNILRYVWSFIIRVGMVLATLKVREIWQNIPSAKPQESETTETPTKCTILHFCCTWLLDKKPIQDTGTTQQGNDEQMPVPLHARLTKEYMEAGEMVQIMTHIFQSWFLFPWIIFFLESSLEVKDIVFIWTMHREIIPLAVIYYVLFNVNQMIFLLIPYMCAQKMNHLHHKCHVRIRNMQLNSEMGNECDLAEQRKMLIERDYDYDFVPRLWGLGFKVEMNSMFYIISLLLGVFFTVFGAVL